MTIDKVEAQIRAEEYAEWLVSEEKRELDRLHLQREQNKKEYLTKVNRPEWNNNTDEQGIEPDPRIDPIIILTINGLPRLARWMPKFGRYEVQGVAGLMLVPPPDVKHWYPVYPESELMFS